MTAPGRWALLLLVAAAAGGCGGDAGGAPGGPGSADPDAARLADLLRVARVREGGGDAAGAEAAWEEVLALRPGNTGALYASARLRRARGDLEGALRRLEALRSEEPVAGRGYLLAAEILSDPASGPLLDLPRAVSFVREAVARNPEDSMTHLALGKVLLLAGEPAEAEPSLVAAARMNPRDAGSRNLLADLHRRAGRPEEARRWSEEASRCLSGAPAAATAAPALPGEGDTRGEAVGTAAGATRNR